MQKKRSNVRFLLDIYSKPPDNSNNVELLGKCFNWIFTSPYNKISNFNGELNEGKALKNVLLMMMRNQYSDLVSPIHLGPGTHILTLKEFLKKRPEFHKNSEKRNNRVFPDTSCPSQSVVYGNIGFIISNIFFSPSRYYPWILLDRGQNFKFCTYLPTWIRRK